MASSSNVAHHTRGQPQPDIVTGGAQIDSEFPFKFTESTDLWYSDGSVILVAENVGFRVYSGILAQQAAVFADMFSIPQPAAQETFEGCPVVQLSDTAYDTLQFLNALLDHSFYDIHQDTMMDIRITAAVHRLSTKYSAGNLRRQSLTELQTIYPDKVDDQIGAKVNKRLQKVPAGGRFLLVNLARETNTLTILPGLLLDCCVCGASVLLNGIDFGGEHMELSNADKVRVLDARFKLVQMLHTVSLRPLYDNSGQCGIQRCHVEKRRLAMTCLKGRDSDGWIWPLVAASSPTGCCERCSMEINECASSGNVALWEKLPEIFGLGNWTTLRAASE